MLVLVFACHNLLLIGYNVYFFPFVLLAMFWEYFYGRMIYFLTCVIYIFIVSFSLLYYKEKEYVNLVSLCVLEKTVSGEEIKKLPQIIGIFKCIYILTIGHYMNMRKKGNISQNCSVLKLLCGCIHLMFMNKVYLYSEEIFSLCFMNTILLLTCCSILLEK